MLIEYDGLKDQRAQIKVIGVGGAGGNAIQRMIKEKLTDVEFIAINTDAQALSVNEAEIKIQIGANKTRGLGAGTDPSIGYHAALESKDRIEDIVRDTDMIIITAGMGGGTGTGAAPVIAEIAKNSGALTIGFVTKPFLFEGTLRNKQALEGIKRLREHVDTLIVVPNEKIFDIIDDETNCLDGFSIADSILNQGTTGISDLITKNGLINLDFADVRTIIKRKGPAVIGVSRTSGPDRAIKAVENAIHCPLLESNSIKGARGLLINFTGGSDMKLNEVRKAASMIYEEAGENANVVFGALIDEDMKDEISVTVIATGLDMNEVDTPQELEPLPLNAIPEIEIVSNIDPEPMLSAPEKEQIKIFEEPNAPSTEKEAIPIFGESMHLDTTIYPLDETQKDNMNVPAYIRKIFKHR
ncbi:MAG: cell division protein FtsZ [Candidatus Neomarinimicrobiota bacterium]|nr:MAG: cell division protein FtsZ [Candidatus Neomarinimicrobiota bacterium]